MSALADDAIRRNPVAVLAALALAGVVAVALCVLIAGLPVAWLLLALCAAIVLCSLAWSIRRGALFEPLALVAAVGLLLFVLRPLQLFTSANDLYSYFPPTSSLDDLLYLENQEIARFVVMKMDHSLESALTRAMGACALFLALFVVGYAVGWFRRLAQWLASLGSGTARLNVRTAVGLPLAIGIAAEIVVLGRAGGPAEALRGAADQSAVGDSVILNLLTGFAPAGLVVWAAWRKPEGRNEWIAFALAFIQLAGFAFIVGSRARIFLPALMLVVVIHYCWRPWRLREIAAAALVILLFATTSLAVREGAKNKSLGEALTDAPEYSVDARAVLNDVNAFDFVVFATQVRPYDRSYRYGGGIVDAVRSYVPAQIDSGKPQGGDIIFRKEVWGDEFRAGRPPTLVGDLYSDFGFVGVGVGALLVGLLARALLGLISDLRAPGREYRVAFYALAVILLYELVTSTYSVALGFAITLGIPLVVAIHWFGRLRTGAAT
jgi:oligosaccharide repeat unit polymerase